MELDYVYVAPTNHVSILLVWLVFSRIILFFLYFETLVFNRVSRLGSEPWSSSELPSPSFISNTILFHTDEAEVLSAYRRSTKDPVSRTGSLGVGTNLHRGWEKNQVLFLLRGDVSQHCVITGFDGKHIVDLQHTHRDSLVITIRNLVTITMKTARCCCFQSCIYIYVNVVVFAVLFYREKIHPIAESKAPICGSRASSKRLSVVSYR